MTNVAQIAIMIFDELFTSSSEDDGSDEELIANLNEQFHRCHQQILRGFRPDSQSNEPHHYRAHDVHKRQLRSETDQACLRRMVKNPKSFCMWPSTKEMVDGEIKRILTESYERAKHILKSHAKEHKALAEL